MLRHVRVTATNQDAQEQGFVHILIAVLLLVVVAAVGYAGYHAVQQAQTSPVATATHLATVPIQFVGQSAADGQPTVVTSTSNSGSTSTTDKTTSTSSSSTSTSTSSTTTSSTPAPTDNGVSGTVTLVTGCKPPAECASTIKPYQATVVVESSSGAAVTSFTSDAQGNFSVVLGAGTYTLVPQSYDSGRITAPQQTVTVTAHQFTTAKITYKETL